MPTTIGNEKLQCYASGDGALHFVWIMPQNGSRVASNRTVSEQDAKDYLASDEGTCHNGWRIWNDQGHFVLIAPVQRIDAETLEVDGRLFHVVIHEKRADGAVMDHKMDVSTTREGETYDVKHISTRAIIRHFLNNEAKIPPL